MKKHTLWFMLAGNLCAVFSMLSRSRFLLEGDAADFIQGLGTGLIIAAFFIFERRGYSGCRSSTAASSFEDHSNPPH